MLRLALVLATLSACTKANQDTASAPADKGIGTKVAVPGDDKPGVAAPRDTAPMTVGGADERFRLKPNEGTLAVEAPADAKAGAEATAKITVTPGHGFHVNTEYPIKLTLETPAGVKLAKTEFKAGGHDKGRGDAEALDESQLVLAVKMTADKSGSYTINGSFKFAVCDKDQCLAKKEPIAIAVAAK
jgi:hypothetical protein